MPTSRKRDNAYWAERLKKDGHRRLIKRVENKDLSMYKATQEAGYRAKKPKSPADSLSYHWKRASYAERFKFVVMNFNSVNSIGRDVTDELKKSKGAEN